MLIKTALKEWSVAVDALAAGETILLLRKGGIKEHQGRFSAEANRVALFPTFEHQRPELLKPQYRKSVEAVPQGWHPETITLKAWADITHIFLTDDADKVAALAAFHIWQPQLAQARLKWKPKQPLYILTLRAYRLAEPAIVPWQATYSGCRSWLPFELKTDLIDSLPAVADADYRTTVEAIETILAS
ncbi:MAG: DUF1802 family protein [Phormidesmis sp.]